MNILLSYSSENKKACCPLCQDNRLLSFFIGVLRILRLYFFDFSSLRREGVGLFYFISGNLSHTRGNFYVVYSALEDFGARTYSIDGNIAVRVAATGPADHSHF